MDQGGDIKVQGRGIVVQEDPYCSTMLPEEELKRMGIVKGGDGRYYKASDGAGGSIVLLPVASRLVRFQLRGET
jgi:hypothetical protein